MDAEEHVVSSGELKFQPHWELGVASAFSLLTVDAQFQGNVPTKALISHAERNANVTVYVTVDRLRNHYIKIGDPSCQAYITYTGSGVCSVAGGAQYSLYR